MLPWYALALASAVLSAAAAVAEKKALFREGALEFSAIVTLFGLVLSLPFLLFIEWAQVTRAAVLVLLLKSVLNAAFFLCVMRGLKELELSGSLPLLTLTPGLVAVVAFLALGESLVLREVLGLVLLVAGTYALGMQEDQGLLDPFRRLAGSPGYRSILAALALSTVTSVLDKVVLGPYKLPPNAFIVLQHAFEAAVLVALALALRRGAAPLREAAAGPMVRWMVLVAALSVGYRYTQILAVKAAPVALVLALKRVSVFIAAVVGGRLFGESHLLRKALATACMVAGAVLIARA